MSAASKKRILITEDESFLSKVLSNKLKIVGFDVTIAEDGSQALDILKESKFDVLLLDLMMPKIDGFTLLEKLKEQGITIPTIIMSNLSQDEDKSKVAMYDIKDYIVKSDTPLEEIVSRVEKVLS